MEEDAAFDNGAFDTDVDDGVHRGLERRGPLVRGYHTGLDFLSDFVEPWVLGQVL